MQRAEFLRLFPFRAKGLMWLTGAGASASAGITTAANMIWHFKQQIFCAERHISVKSCPNIGDAVFQTRLNNYFQSKGGYPPAGSDEEYAFYFDAAYPNERDRRSYIDRMIEGAIPSNGSIGLAVLAKLGLLKTLWTTNFDRLPDDAFTKVFGTTTSFAVSTLDNPELAEQALAEGKRPVIGKLHGDFVSRRLKNTNEELKTQDQRLRRSLVNECKGKGLVVVGYSGRDHSVMEALEEAIDGGQGYPNGLFWFHRPDSRPMQSVITLIEKAAAAKVDAHLIEAETFDEMMMDIFVMLDYPDELAAFFDQRRPRLSLTEVPPAGQHFPVIRMNAIPLEAVPATCRRVVCEIGGSAEVREAISTTGANIVALRSNVGVIAFGSDDEVRKAFTDRKITEFDLHPIDVLRLEVETAEHGLLNEALVRALCRERNLDAIPTRNGWKVFVRPDAAPGHAFQQLRTAAGGAISGTIGQTRVRWAEAVLMKIERRLNQTWMVFEPSVWTDRLESETEQDSGGKRFKEQTPERAAVKEFVRERAAKRYNFVLGNLLDGWLDVFLGINVKVSTVRTFGIGDGIDASFTLHRTTAYSYRGGRA